MLYTYKRKACLNINNNKKEVKSQKNSYDRRCGWEQGSGWTGWHGCRTKDLDAAYCVSVGHGLAWYMQYFTVPTHGVDWHTIASVYWCAFGMSRYIIWFFCPFILIFNSKCCLFCAMKTVLKAISCVEVCYCILQEIIYSCILGVRTSFHLLWTFLLLQLVRSCSLSYTLLIFEDCMVKSEWNGYSV